MVVVEVRLLTDLFSEVHWVGGAILDLVAFFWLVVF